jgi:selenocysteine-specific elongation factor
VRVRGVQVHGAAAEQTIAGERTALNLAGAATEDLARGMTLILPGAFHSTQEANVSLSMLVNAKPLRDRTQVHLHTYTSETIAEVVLLEGKLLPPGKTGFAQLRFREPLLILPGDRFIIRQFSPVVTIGGGVVVDASPLVRRVAKEKKQVLASLPKLANGSRAEILAERVARRGRQGLTLAAAVAETGWWPPKIVQQAAASLQPATLLAIGDVFISTAAFQQAKNDAAAAVTLFHQANPLVGGISKGELREKLDLEESIFNGVLDTLVREKKIEVSGEQVHAAGRGVVMKDEEAESKKIIEQAFATAGLKVPALKDVLAGVKVDRVRAQKIMTLLLRDRVLVKLADDLVFHRDALDQLRQMLAAQKAKSPKIDVARFKDLTGVSRKYAIPLLEYLDRERITRRVGDERVIL